jgi:hypothetical protein
MNWLPRAMHMLRDELKNIQVSSDYSPDLAEALVRGRLDVALESEFAKTLSPGGQDSNLRISKSQAPDRRLSSVDDRGKGPQIIMTSPIVSG